LPSSKAILKKRGNPPLIPTPQRWLHFIANHIRQHRFECTLEITTLFPQSQSVWIDRSVLPRGPTDDPNSVSRGHSDAPIRVMRDSASPPLTYGQNDEPCGIADRNILRVPEKNLQKKVTEARLEPWSIIFCNIPHLFESGGWKATDSSS
jgi:hypothetical protein